MGEFILRNFRPGDAPAISDMFRTAYGDHYAHHQVYLPRMINENHARQRWHSLVAVQGKNIVGHAALCRESQAPIAEFALAVVDPASRGQGIATHLARHLLVHAQALKYRGVTMKQVTAHAWTQRLATTLGFHSTGLLPDYVPSLSGTRLPETIVIGYKPLDGFALPLPAFRWPESHAQLRAHLMGALGVSSRTPRKRLTTAQFEHCNDRHDVVIARLDRNLLAQLERLPGAWLISLRLRLTARFATDLMRLAGIGFHFSGLAPDEHATGWMALFHRGHQARLLQLHCPHMQHLHGQIQPTG